MVCLYWKCKIGIFFADSITFYQFCDILKEEKPLSKSALVKAFKKIDVNGDGFVSHQELQNVLTMVRKA